MLTITTYTNLQCLYLQNTNISSVPHNIDKLQKLEYFYLNNNKLSSLPTNILNLPNLQIFNIQNNLFPSSDIQIFQSRFNQTNPNITLYVWTSNTKVLFHHHTGTYIISFNQKIVLLLIFLSFYAINYEDFGLK